MALLEINVVLTVRAVQHLLLLRQRFGPCVKSDSRVGEKRIHLNLQAGLNASKGFSVGLFIYLHFVSNVQGVFPSDLRPQLQKHFCKTDKSKKNPQASLEKLSGS